MRNKIVLLSVLFLSLLLVQCSEDDNNNIIDPDPTCNDGIQNGDEEGVDCGGSNCDPCEEGPEGIDFSGTFVQEDQVGRPGVASFYITTGLRDDYNTTIPSEMATVFQENIKTNILELHPDFETNGLGQDTTAFATMLANDVLWVAQTGTTTYYDGTTIMTGRTLTDDVMDFQLQLLFGGSDLNNPDNDGSGDSPLLIRDGVDANDKPFLEDFPYLAAPF